jgi:hypothetical protein
MPLGVEDKRIRNGAMTASTFYTASLSPKYGRLHHIYSWSVKTNNRNQWLQIYFIVKTRVTGVATQGRHVMLYLFSSKYFLKKVIVYLKFIILLVLSTTY